MSSRGAEGGEEDRGIGWVFGGPGRGVGVGDCFELLAERQLGAGVGVDLGEGWVGGEGGEDVGALGEVCWLDGLFGVLFVGMLG